jgi:hypothetical protein
VASGSPGERTWYGVLGADGIWGRGAVVKMKSLMFNNFDTSSVLCLLGGCVQVTTLLWALAFCVILAS